MPLDDGFGLDYGQRILPVVLGSRQNDPQRSVSVRQLRSFDIPLEDIELMTECEVLQNESLVGFQRRQQRAEKIGNHGSYDIIASS